MSLRPATQHLRSSDTYVSFTRFEADKDTMDALASLRNKIGAGGRGEATAGDPAFTPLLWGMLYADNGEVVSQSSEQLKGR